MTSSERVRKARYYLSFWKYLLNFLSVYIWQVDIGNTIQHFDFNIAEYSHIFPCRSLIIKSEVHNVVTWREENWVWGVERWTGGWITVQNSMNSSKYFITRKKKTCDLTSLYWTFPFTRNYIKDGWNFLFSNTKKTNFQLITSYCKSSFNWELPDFCFL